MALHASASAARLSGSHPTPPVQARGQGVGGAQRSSRAASAPQRAAGALLWCHRQTSGCTPCLASGGLPSKAHHGRASPDHPRSRSSSAGSAANLRGRPRWPTLMDQVLTVCVARRKPAAAGQGGSRKRQSLEHISLELLQEQGYFDMPIQVSPRGRVLVRPHSRPGAAVPSAMSSHRAAPARASACACSPPAWGRAIPTVGTACSSRSAVQRGRARQAPAPWR